MKRKIGIFVIIALLFILTLYPVHQTYAARATGTVKNRILNVRSSSSTSSSIVCKLSQGTRVTIISETTGDDGLKWYNVYFAYNGGTSEGYVRADLLTVSGTVSGSTAAADNSSSGKTLYVNKTSVRVRKSAVVGSEIVATLEKGAEVRSQGTTTGADGNQWTSVTFSKGGQKQGYIRSDLLSSTKPSGSGNKDTATSETLYVSASSVHVRKSADPTSSSLTGLSKGTEVRKLSAKTGSDGRSWTKVSFTKDGVKTQGYIRSDLLTSEKPAGSSSTSSSDDETLYVSASAVRVRDSASASSEVVANLLNGDTVKKKSTKTGDDGKEWTKVSFTINSEKYQGYIRSDYLTSQKPTDSQSASSEEEYRYVSASALRVRESASTSSEVVANLLKGDKVKIKSTKTGSDGKEWAKVSFTINGTKYHGYIRTSYLSSTKPSDDSSDSGAQNNSGSTGTAKTGTVRLAIVNLRQTASTNSSIMAKISQGTKVTILSETTGSDEKKWYNVSCVHNGATVKGYIRADLLNL